jgi:hypothetical protein
LTLAGRTAATLDDVLPPPLGGGLTGRAVVRDAGGLLAVVVEAGGDVGGPDCVGPEDGGFDGGVFCAAGLGDGVFCEGGVANGDVAEGGLLDFVGGATTFVAAGRGPVLDDGVGFTGGRAVGGFCPVAG